MRVKIIKKSSFIDLEDYVNAFIADKRVENISYAAIVSDAQEQAEYSAMIIYR